MQKLSTSPSQDVKERGNEKETFPPSPPIEKKQGAKEIKTGLFTRQDPSKPRARARTCVKEPTRACSPAEAGWAAQHIVESVLRCPQSNRRLWAAFCLYNNPDDIIQLAYDYASYGRQGEVNNPVTAFQAKLNEKYPETVAYLVARKNARNGGAK